MFRNYFKIAFRNLANNKVYSLINIAGLTIGLTCAMLILLYVKDEVSFDRFNRQSARIFRVVYQYSNHGEEQRYVSTSLLQGPKFAQNIPGIKSFTRIQDGRVDFKNEADIESKEVLFVDANFFSTFTFPLIAGDANTCLKSRHSVVLTKDEAKKQFGTTNAVGKVMMVNDKGSFVPYEVTAVTENCPQNSSVQYKMLLPIRGAEDAIKNNGDWFSYYLSTFVVLDEHANPDVVATQMQRFYEQDAAQTFADMMAKFGNGRDHNIGTYSLQPLLDIHMSTDFAASNGLENASNPIYAYILSGIAGFVLLIASINFVNLTVARSVRRAKEIGIRKSIGSDRRQLIIQFLGESFILCGIAFVLAILLAQLILPIFNELANKKLAMSYLLDAKLIFGYMGLFLITGLLAGFYPALVLSGYSPIDTLYSRFALKGKGMLQKILVVLQFTLASFLIIATFTIYAQFNYLTRTDLGYDDKDLVVVSGANVTHEEAATFKNELLKSPDILYVAPKNGGRWATMARLANDSAISFAYETVDESFLPAMKIPLVMGRNFSTQFPGDSAHAILVNESFVKKAGWKNPLGQSVIFNFKDNKTYEVIGVVKDYHFAALNEKIGEQLFTMENSNPYGTFYVKIRPNSASRSLQFIAQKFRTFFPLKPYSYVFKNEANLKSYESETRWKQIILFGAILTIFISCIGLFGLSVLSAEKRTKEIGIRKVLGASVRSIATVLSVEFVKLVMIALVIAVPLSWMAANKWLENYPYRITLGWTIFVAAGALVLMIAVCTVSFQAVKAAYANPVKSLRSE
ncbi:ABC transporter permease [Chitinophaga silvisoli]|uniref:ABC transporter permease n=1 Tax=Chitinophaga silvisoli TaxID=2291814 RepID=A0A3E1NZY0_9BACT|nr:ABC transporter permease [Chitinophaga silvisoli]RFM33450.1 ABC transporter permease [Chitinophaga silvisoli]